MTDNVFHGFPRERWLLPLTAIEGYTGPTARYVRGDLFSELTQSYDDLQARIERARPYCVAWASFIPTLAGPYDLTWRAHDRCPPHKHGLFLYPFPPVESIVAP